MGSQRIRHGWSDWAKRPEKGVVLKTHLQVISCNPPRPQLKSSFHSPHTLHHYPISFTFPQYCEIILSTNGEGQKVSVFQHKSPLTEKYKQQIPGPPAGTHLAQGETTVSQLLASGHPNTTNTKGNFLWKLCKNEKKKKEWIDGNYPYFTFSAEITLSSLVLKQHWHSNP